MEPINSDHLNFEDARSSAPKLSVIVPVLDDQIGVDACLAALSKQTWPNTDRYEVIVVDNGSSPPIRLKPEYQALARVVVSRETGAYAARNAGILAAHGSLLAFTDADCIPDRDWLREGVAALERAGMACVGGPVELRMTVNPTAVERYQTLVGFLQRENIESRGFSVTANLFAPRACFEQAGLFDESLLSGGDGEWAWRAAGAGWPTVFAPAARVSTLPRRTLRSAIRQARRVAGGRYALRRRNLPHVDREHLQPQRSASASVLWLLTHPGLSPIERVKCLWVGSVLKVARVAESMRLRLGWSPERR